MEDRPVSGMGAENNSARPLAFLTSGLEQRVRQMGSLSGEDKVLLLGEANSRLAPEVRAAVKNVGVSRAEFERIQQEAIDRLTEITSGRFTGGDEERNRILIEVTDGLTKAKELVHGGFDAAVMEIRSANEAPRTDELTGLHLKREVLDHYNLELQHYLEQGSGLADISMKYCDLMNFKLGNHLLSEMGFNLFLAEYAGWFKDLSILTGSELYETGVKSLEEIQLPLYWFGGQYERSNANKIASQADRDAGARRGLEMREVKQVLEEMKGEGIVFEPYRDKAGGDEMLMVFRYSKGKTEEREELANRFFETVVGIAKLPRHDILSPGLDEELGMIGSKVQNFMNELKIYPKADYGAEGQVDRNLNKFADKVRSYWMTKQAKGEGILAQIATDGGCQIKMACSAVEFDYEQALERYLFGTSPWDGEASEESLFVWSGEKGDWEVNEAVMAGQREALALRIELYLTEVVNRESQDVAGMGMEILGRDILGVTIGDASVKVEEQKDDDKQDLIVKAMIGDAAAAYQVGALLAMGRLTDGLNEDTKRTILAKIYRGFEGKMEQLQKDPAADELVHFMSSVTAL